MVSYRFKTQSMIAMLSTEAEFMVAIICTKQAKYLGAVMYGLGFDQLINMTLPQSSKAMLLSF